MAIQQGHYGNYTGNARCCGSSGPLKEKDSTIHKHYMENAVHDLEKGDKRAGEYEASRASSFKNIGMHLKGATASAAAKTYGSVESAAMKNVLGPDNPHTHGKGGKVVMDNATKKIGELHGSISKPSGFKKMDMAVPAEQLEELGKPSAVKAKKCHHNLK